MSFPKLQRTHDEAFNSYPLKKLRRYVDKSYSGDISVEQAARILGLEEASMHAYFLAVVGISFSDWASLVRIAKATEGYAEFRSRNP